MRALLLIALLLAACGDAPAADPATPPVDTVSADPASTTPAASPAEVPAASEADDADLADAEPVPAEMAYRVVSAQAGDVACYLDLEPEAGGPVETYLAGFEVCERVDGDGLTGRLVMIIIETASVIAASCEGDPDCLDTEPVDLVMAVDPVD